MRKLIGIRDAQSSQIVAVPDRLPLLAVLANSGGPGRALDFSLIVFDNGAVFRSSLVVSKSCSFDWLPLPAVFANSGGPVKRNTMNVTRGSFTVYSPVYAGS